MKDNKWKKVCTIYFEDLVSDEVKYWESQGYLTKTVKESMRSKQSPTGRWDTWLLYTKQK